MAEETTPLETDIQTDRQNVKERSSFTLVIGQPSDDQKLFKIL